MKVDYNSLLWGTGLIALAIILAVLPKDKNPDQEFYKKINNVRFKLQFLIALITGIVIIIRAFRII